MLRCKKDKQKKKKRSDLREKRCRRRGGKKKNHTNHCSLYSWDGAMCIKPKSINKTLKSPLFHFKGNGCCNHKDLFFLFLFLSSLSLRISLLLHWRPTCVCVWSDSVESTRHVDTTDGSGGEVCVWSCCWGLHSILTRFHFFWKDETWFDVYIIFLLHLFFCFFLNISSVIVSNVPTNSRWDYTYYIISRGLQII